MKKLFLKQLPGSSLECCFPGIDNHVFTVMFRTPTFRFQFIFYSFIFSCYSAHVHSSYHSPKMVTNISMWPFWFFSWYSRYLQNFQEVQLTFFFSTNLLADCPVPHWQGSFINFRSIPSLIHHHRASGFAFPCDFPREEAGKHH